MSFQRVFVTLAKIKIVKEGSQFKASNGALEGERVKKFKISAVLSLS